MSSAEVLRMVVAAGVGGLVGFVWSQLSFGNRLTRIEVQIENLERTLHGGQTSAPRQA